MKYKYTCGSFTALQFHLQLNEMLQGFDRRSVHVLEQVLALCTKRSNESISTPVVGMPGSHFHRFCLAWVDNGGR